MDWETFWQLVIAVTVLQVITFLGARVLLGLVLGDLYRRIADLETRVDALEDQGPPAPPPFVVGETLPDDDTVGAGIVRAYPTKVITTKTTYSGPPQTITDTVFMDVMICESPGWVFENCVFRGSSTPESAGGCMVVTTKAAAGDDRVPLFRYCDFNPQVASSYWNGIGYKNYRLEQCHVWGCTDALAAFALSADPDPAVHVQVIGTWLERMSQFKPDIAGNRDVTHNDLIQLQGNVGPDDDVFFDGCRLDAYFSQTQSSPVPTERTQVSAFMLSPSGACQDRVCLTVKRSWISGGIFTLNGASTKLGSSVLVLVDNVWEAPSQSTGGPSAAIALDASLTRRSITGQVYEDGSPVSVYNA